MARSPRPLLLLLLALPLLGCQEDEICPLIEATADGKVPSGEGKRTACGSIEGSTATQELTATFLSQSHCEEIAIRFGLADPTFDGSCSYDYDSTVATLRYVAHGPGTYRVSTADVECLRADDGTILGIPEGQDPFAATVTDAQGQRAQGEVEIEQTGLDVKVTRGSIDVELADGRRLVAEFAAPLCETE